MAGTSRELFFGWATKKNGSSCRKRVNQALEAGIQWKYCPIEDNPADLETRGTTPERLQACSNEWEGPEWLTRQSWSQRPKTQENGAVKEERRKVTIINATTFEASRGICQSMNAIKYASGRKLYRITA